MTRSQLYSIAGLLALLVVALGAYLVYQDQNRPKLEIRIDGGGIQVNGNG